MLLQNALQIETDHVVAAEKEHVLGGCWQTVLHAARRAEGRFLRVAAQRAVAEALVAEAFNLVRLIAEQQMDLPDPRRSHLTDDRFQQLHAEKLYKRLRRDLRQGLQTAPAASY